MSSAVEISKLEERVELKKQLFMTEISKYINAESDLELAQFHKSHQAATDYFNSVERLASLSSVLGGKLDDIWFRNHVERCQSVLKSIENWYSCLKDKSVHHNLDYKDFLPSSTSFSSIQRTASNGLSNEELHHIKENFSQLALPVLGLTKRRYMDRYSRLDKWAVGTAAFILIIWYTVFVSIWPNPTESQQAAFRTIVALLAGVIGSFLIGGSVEVEGKIRDIIVRGTGGAALFIVVYFFSPDVF